jgi:hypothetical protein
MYQMEVTVLTLTPNAAEPAWSRPPAKKSIVQLGSAVASHIPKSMLVRGLGILFIVVATLTLGEAFLL